MLAGKFKAYIFKRISKLSKCITDREEINVHQLHLVIWHNTF